MSLIAQLGLEQWLTYTFDRPVTNNGWDYDWDPYYYGPDDTRRVAYWTYVFEDCETVLAPFSDAHVAQGLFYMIGASGGQAQMLRENSAPLADRLRCIHSMQTLFEKYFAKRCSPHLSQLETDIPSEGLSPLNGICYMWWDILPIHGMVKCEPYNPHSAQIDDAILSVIKHCLTIDSIACQESALFGLVEWRGYYPELDDEIDGFIDHHAELYARFKPGIREKVFGR